MAKPSLMVLLGSKEPDGDEDMGSDGYELSEEKLDAGKEAMRAMKAGDAEAFTRAVCMLVDLHAEPDDSMTKEKE